MTGFSCDICITEQEVTLYGIALSDAQLPSYFYNILGPPDRIEPIGGPAPAGHRNPVVHYYDQLGLVLVEHHFTYQISLVEVILNPAESVHPVNKPFSGQLRFGRTVITAGAMERDLIDSGMTFTGTLPGTWFATIHNKPPVYPSSVSVRTLGPRLSSGRRSKRRDIQSVQIGLNHDPWETAYRPASG